MRKSAVLLGASALSAPAIFKAQANTLTGLIPTLYAGLSVVSRELVGFIPAVSRNTSAERAAIGQSIVWPIAPRMGTFNVTPAMATPEPADVVIGNNNMTITKSKGVEFGWTGEEQLALSNGVGYLPIQRDLFAQGLRTLVNEIEADIAAEAAANASRAWGTPGTTPFGTDKMTDLAQLRKILDDNGAPLSDRSAIIDTAAGANMRTMYNLTRVNEAGTEMTLRDGELLNVHGFSIHESAAVPISTKGTAAGATTNAAGYPVGATSITLAAAGTGTIKKGDVVTFAGDPNKYVVAVALASVSGQTLVLNSPGLRRAIPAAATAITVGDNATLNVGFSRSALGLAIRAPALPEGGDAAVDRVTLTDPRSGLTFEVSLYKGYRKIRAEVTAAWGVKAINPEHIALLLG